MRRIQARSFVVFALLVPACDSTPKDSTPTSKATDPSSKPAEPKPQPESAKPQTAAASDGTCKVLCQSTAKLKCGTSETECTQICLDMLKVPGCGDQGQAFLRCAVKQPVAKFECDEGSASLLSDVCAGEQAAFVKCLGT